jgi:hypothetical protein
MRVKQIEGYVKSHVTPQLGLIRQQVHLGMNW